MSKKRTLEAEISDLKAEISQIYKQQAVMDEWNKEPCCFRNGRTGVCKECKKAYDAVSNLTYENFDEFDFSSIRVLKSLYWACPTWEECKDIESVNLMLILTSCNSIRDHFLKEMDKEKLRSLLKARYSIRSNTSVITYDMLPLITEAMYIGGNYKGLKKELKEKIGKETSEKWFKSAEFLALKQKYKQKIRDLKNQ